MVNPLEHRLASLARQFAQRERANGLLRATMAFSGLTVALGLCFLLLEGRAVPLALPCGIYAALLVICWRRFLGQRISPSREQIALFLDEQHPELENLFITGATAASQRGRLPEWVLDRIIEAARIEADRTSLPALFTHRDDAKWAVRRFGIAAVGVAALFAVFTHWDLDRLGTGLITGLIPKPLPFSVEPGNARIRTGSDQIVWLRTGDRTSAKTIRWREAGGSWRNDVFLPSRSPDVFYYRLTTVQADTDYGVRVGSQETESYHLTVYTPPAITAIDLTRHDPDYLGQPPVPLPYSQHLALPQGGELSIEVHVNKPLVSGDLIFAVNPDRLPLEQVTALTWYGRWVITHDDSFRVHLIDGENDTNEDAPWHVVKARIDEAPVVRIREPRGDSEASRIEEVPFVFSVKDDHGLRDFGIQYEKPGSEPVRISLMKDRERPREASVDHLLALEDLTLEPGDYLVWSVWAEDARPDRELYETLGDPYFLEIRPFRRTFSEAITNEGQQGTGGDQDPAGKQKQIIIGTWNLRRHARTLDLETFENQRNRLAKAQLDLAEQDLPPSEQARTFRETANAAAAALRDVDPSDPAPKLADALTEEQRAYRILLKLRPSESQITRSGGRGRERDQRAIEALELSERRDFEEQATTLGQQLEDTEAVRDRIDDLARRQATINRDINDLVSDRPELNEKEEEQRRLERLLDEQRRTLADLDDLQSNVASRSLDPEQAAEARGRLGQAREQMERGLDNLEQGELQQARAAGRRARSTLDQANEQLQQLSRQAAAERMQQLQQQLRALSQEQQAIRDRIAEQETNRGDLAASEAVSKDILEQKRNLAEDFTDFMNETGALAERSAQSQRLLSNRLGDWLRRTSRAGIYEDIQKGERYIRYGVWDVSRDFESSLSDRLEQAADSLDALAGDAVRDDLEAMRRALTTLEDLVEDGSEDDPIDILGNEGSRGGGWDAQLRAAESLLPDGSDIQQGVTDVRNSLESLGRRYRASNQLPHRDIVVRTVMTPLTEIVDQLRTDIQHRERGLRLDIPDGRSVPERYRDHVAEYFRTLSESAGSDQSVSGSDRQP